MNKKRQKIAKRKIPSKKFDNKVVVTARRRTVSVEHEDWSRRFDIRICEAKIKGRTCYLIESLDDYDNILAWYLDCVLKFHCTSKALWAAPPRELAAVMYCQALFLQQCRDRGMLESEYYDNWLKRFAISSEWLGDNPETEPVRWDIACESILSALEVMSQPDRNASMIQATENAFSQIYVFTHLCEAAEIEIPSLCA